MVSDDDTETAVLPTGKALRLAAVMLTLCAAFSLGVGYLTRAIPQDRAVMPARAAASAAMPRPVHAARNELTYRADSHGQFFIEAEVNGTAVRFLVDTGATWVALTPKDAAAIGLSPDSHGYTVLTNTAKGVARNARVRLREVRLGQLSVEDVPALVMEDASDISLLGMSFLARLDGYRIRDGVLTLEW